MSKKINKGIFFANYSSEFYARAGAVAEAIARWCILILVALMPILFVPGFGSLNFITQQTFAATAVFLALIFWILSVLLSGKIVLPDRSKYLYLSFTALPIALLASWLWSPSLYNGFWGSGAPQDFSLINFTVWLLAFLMLPILFKNKSDIVKLLVAFGISLIAAVLIFIAGTAAFLYWKKPLLGLKSVSDFNFIGTINAFSAFLGVGFILMLGFFKNLSKDSGKRLAVLGLALLIFVIFVVIGYGYAVWSMVAALGVFLGFWVAGRFKSLGDNLVGLNSILLFLFILLAVMLLGYKFNGFLGLAPENLPDFRSSLSVLQKTYTVGAKSAILGSGPNTFVSDYAKYADPAVSSLFATARIGVGRSWWLTLAPTLGVVGTALLLGLLVAVFAVGLRKLLPAIGREIYDGGIGIVAALFFLFAFSFVYPLSFALATYMFILAGVLIAFILIFFGKHQEVILFKQPSLALGISISFTALLVGCVFLAVAVGQRHRSAVVAASAAVSYEKNGDIDVAAKRMEKSFAIFKNEYAARSLSVLWLARLDRIVRGGGVAAQKEEATATANGAIESARAAIMLNGENDTNWNMLGDIYAGIAPLSGSAQTINNEAVGAYKKAIELNPANPFYLLSLGKTYLAQAQTADRDAAPALLRNAEENLKATILLSPELIEARLILSAIYERQDRLEEAIREVQTVLNQNPNNLDALFRWGLLEYSAKNSDAATEIMNRVLATNPQYASAYYLLGLIYEGQDEKSDAVSQFEEYLKLDPSNQAVVDKIKQLKK